MLPASQAKEPCYNISAAHPTTCCNSAQPACRSTGGCCQTEPFGRILLVEDNSRIAEVTMPLLEDLGLVPQWAPDAEAALAKLRSDEDQFDLVLTDVVMPGMSGIALGRAISHHWPGLPVILTSGYSDDLTAGHGGDFDLIQKPYSRNALLTILGRHLKAEPEAA